MFHPVPHSPGDLPVPPPAPLHGLPVEPIKGLYIGHLFKTGEYHPWKIPIPLRPIGHLKGVEDRFGGVGKLIHHGPGGIEEIVLPAGIIAR